MSHFSVAGLRELRIGLVKEKKMDKKDEDGRQKEEWGCSMIGAPGICLDFAD